MEKKQKRKRRKSLDELADEAMKAAAESVIEENRRFGEPLIVWENGRVKKIPIDELSTSAHSRRKIATSAGYDDLLHAELRDPEFAAGYLTACLEEGEEVFLLGVSNVAKAQAAPGKFSRRSRRGALFTDDDPRLSSIQTVLKKLGILISFKAAS